MELVVFHTLTLALPNGATEIFSLLAHGPTGLSFHLAILGTHIYQVSVIFGTSLGVMLLVLVVVALQVRQPCRVPVLVLKVHRALVLKVHSQCSSF